MVNLFHRLTCTTLELFLEDHSLKYGEEVYPAAFETSGHYQTIWLDTRMSIGGQVALNHHPIISHLKIVEISTALLPMMRMILKECNLRKDSILIEKVTSSAIHG